MPSPRAVLADITDLGLHPEEHHRVVGAGGRLKVSPSTVQVEAPKAPEKVVEEPKVETPVVEDKAPEVTEQAEVASTDQVEETSTETEKKPKRGKKQAPPVSQ